jgi:hypothetical protein
VAAGVENYEKRILDFLHFALLLNDSGNPKEIQSKTKYTSF